MSTDVVRFMRDRAADGRFSRADLLATLDFMLDGPGVTRGERRAFVRGFGALEAREDVTIDPRTLEAFGLSRRALARYSEARGVYAPGLTRSNFADLVRFGRRRLGPVLDLAVQHEDPQRTEQDVHEAEQDHRREHLPGSDDLAHAVAGEQARDDLGRRAVLGRHGHGGEAQVAVLAPAPLAPAEVAVAGAQRMAGTAVAPVAPAGSRSRRARHRHQQHHHRRHRHRSPHRMLPLATNRAGA